MKINLREVSVRELVQGYTDDNEGGVVGYGGKLDIRPPYQREFIYKDKQRDAVIDTIIRGFPLNVMYWSVRGDGTFEVIDGQQRTISIAKYVQGDFSLNKNYFTNLQGDKQEQILNYELMVYFCRGKPSEKLEWFKTINIAGEKLKNQELRNAVYAGSWVSDAKRYFSRTSCAAYMMGKDYMEGSPIRQEYLETVIKWISNNDIEDYMGRHQHDPDAKSLWEYFRLVIDWVETTFTGKRSIMKGLQWGDFYNDHKDRRDLDPENIEREVEKLVLDDDVTQKSGIYPYILTRDEKQLNIRLFTEDMRLKVYEKQKSKCKRCKKAFDISKMEADHITPWSQGGKTNENNCQMLCKECNRRKSSK